jgi:ribosomal-protein-alanine N-acetyltransferase
MEETKFSLRPATSEDLPQLITIEKQVHVAPWTEEHFSAELSKPYSRVYVLTDDDTDSRIAGYIVCWMMFDNCQILNLAVDLPFRGLGMAKFMVRKAISLAGNKEIKKLILEVRKLNMPAIQLYQGLGFTITHILKGFYSNGEDAYQLTYSFQEAAIDF